jgi:hypothetical protein
MTEFKLETCVCQVDRTVVKNLVRKKERNSCERSHGESISTSPGSSRKRNQSEAKSKSSSEPLKFCSNSKSEIELTMSGSSEGLDGAFNTAIRQLQELVRNSWRILRRWSVASFRR